MFQRTSSHHGFTLIEMLICTAIIAILAGLALPAFGRLMGKTRAQGARSELVAALNAARIAAITRGIHIVACPSVDQRHCTDGTQWHLGWIVFADLHHDRELNEDETPLATGQAQPQGIAVIGSLGRSRISYQPDGSSRGSNATLTLCDRASGAAGASTLVLGPSGRLRIGKPDAAATAQCLAAAR